MSEKIHALKTVNPYFDDVCNGFKSFEIRINDRNFAVGDILILKEYSTETQAFSGREIARKVTHILNNYNAVLPNHAVMSTRPLSLFERAKFWLKTKNRQIQF